MPFGPRSGSDLSGSCLAVTSRSQAQPNNQIKLYLRSSSCILPMFIGVSAWRLIVSSEQYNEFFFADIKLLTLCFYHHRRTRLNAMTSFFLRSLLLICPRLNKPYDIISGCSEGLLLDALRFFLKYIAYILRTTLLLHYYRVHCSSSSRWRGTCMYVWSSHIAEYGSTR